MFLFLHKKEYGRGDESPVLEHISRELKQRMRKTRTRGANPEFMDTRDDDEVFIAEAILKRDMDRYLVKCVGYEAEWMESTTIPSFLLEHFKTTGSTRIPLPHIMSTSTTGNIVYNTLTWKHNPDLPLWRPNDPSMFPDYGPEESNDLDSGEGPPLTCNTKKDKDSRFHRHTAGIFIGKGKITDMRKLKILELIVKRVCFNKPSNLLF